MSIDKKISSLVPEQLPDFVREEGPKLQAFMEAYYRYLEQTGKAIDASKNLLSYQDIDETLPQFLKHFRAEILKGFPEDAVIDKTLIAKHIRDMYRQKGTDKSYKFLFRALFNEDVELYLPGDYVLRTSDGRWIKETFVRVSQLTSEDATNIQGEVIVGQTSGAYGRVQGINQVLEIGQLVTELLLTSVIGKFIDGEDIVSDVSGITAPIYTVSGPIKNLQIQKWTNILPRGFGAGLFHRSGDSFTITSDAGSGASGTIIAVNDKSAVNVNIIDGGSGYVVGNPVVITKVDAGVGASAEVTGITDTEIIRICQDTIDSVQNVVLNTGPTFVSLGTNTTSVSANLAAANVTNPDLLHALDYDPISVGTISQVTMFSYGSGYTTLPRVTSTNANIATQLIPDGSGGILGDNAVLDAVYLPGSIEAVSITTPGFGYSRFENLGIVNASRSGTVNAVATPLLSATGEKDGRYVSTKGFISWDQRLQDSYYYQDFSYVIRSNQIIDDYRDVVDELIHPSGTVFFGEYQIYSIFDSYVDNTVQDIKFELIEIFDIVLNDANTANIVTVIDPAYNDTSGNLYIFNYSTLAPFLAPTVGTGVPTTINAFGEIAIGDLNSSKLVFGNNTHFNPPTGNTNFFSSNVTFDTTVITFDTNKYGVIAKSGQTMPGFIRQLPTNANTIIGNSGTEFNIDHRVGDMIWSRNTANEESIFVKIIQIDSASSMITNPALRIVDGQYQANVLFAQTANTTAGSRLVLPPPILDSYDMIIFNSTGANTDGQYAVNVVSSTVNTVMSLSAPYTGPTLSNGQFAWIDPGFLPE
jgi:hypothetical protein